tara:strand:- start:1266 stop:1766 length:501 start_codon:yes stop_codon:yes gene_type:complete
MKKLVLLLLIIPFVSLGQIGQATDVEKPKLLGKEVNLYGTQGINGSVRIFVMGKTNGNGQKLYTLKFQNQEYEILQDGVSVPFYASATELDYLFNQMKMVFKLGKSEIKVIPVGDSKFVITKVNSNEILISIDGQKNGYFNVNPAGLHFLFGKRWNKKEWKAYLKS